MVADATQVGAKQNGGKADGRAQVTRDEGERVGEREEAVGLIKSNPETVAELAKALTESKDVKDALNNLGIKIFSHGEKLVLMDYLSSSENPQLSHIPAFQFNTKDLISGDSSGLASAIYNAQKGEETDPGVLDALRVKSTIRALVACAAIRYNCFKESFGDDARKGASPELTVGKFRGIDGRVFEMSLAITGDPHMAKIKFDHELTTTEPFDSITGKGAIDYLATTVEDKVFDKYEDILTKENQLDGLVFAKDELGHTNVKWRDKDLGTYDFATEQSVRDLAKMIKDNVLSYTNKDGEVTVDSPFSYSPEALAYVIGSVSNYKMEPDPGIDNMVVGTFSGIGEEQGSAFINLVNVEN